VARHAPDGADGRGNGQGASITMRRGPGQLRNRPFTASGALVLARRSGAR
jgi:hypothetical protein